MKPHTNLKSIHALGARIFVKKNQTGRQTDRMKDRWAVGQMDKVIPIYHPLIEWGYNNTTFLLYIHS